MRQVPLRRNTQALWTVGLLLLGAVLRFSFLGDLPAGLNQDEASAGYEAWALLHSGMDRCGNSWPVLFVSWGSGQNVLYSYLSLPFLALFGLNVWSLRLVAALCGTLTLPLFSSLAARLFGPRAGRWALALLAVNPWHIMASRWALESNLLPFFLLLGIWLLVQGMERPPLLLGAGAAFALCLYAYGTAFFFLPLFLAAAFVLLLRRRALRPGWTLAAVGLFLLLAAPILVCQVRNFLQLPTVHWGPLTLPRLTQTRQMATSVFGGGSLWENLSCCLRVLVFDDGTVYNALPGFGLFYPFGLVLALIGAALLALRRVPAQAGAGLLWTWLCCGLVCGALIYGNVNRLNFLMLPLILLQAPALDYLTKKRWAAPAASAVLAVSVALFLSAYAQAARAMPSFPQGLDRALEQAKASGAETVLVTDSINMPYIYVLFYEQIPPEEFSSQVIYRDPDADFRRVERFGSWRFGDDPQPGECYLSPASEGWQVQLMPEN